MSGKIRNIFKDKKKLLTLIIIVIVIILVIFTIIFKNDNGFIGLIKNPDGANFKSEYEELNGVVNEDDKEYPEVNISINNNFKYANIDEILNIFNNYGDAVIYFGYAECLYCRSAIQVLYDTAKDTELDKIYYLDVDEKGDKYNQLLNVMDEKFIIEEDGNREIYSPLVLFVANGNVVSYNKGTLFSQADPYVQLDDSQIEGLSEIYKYGINDVLESIRLKNIN